MREDPSRTSARPSVLSPKASGAAAMKRKLIFQLAKFWFRPKILLTIVSLSGKVLREMREKTNTRPIFFSTIRSRPLPINLCFVFLKIILKNFPVTKPKMARGKFSNRFTAIFRVFIIKAGTTSKKRRPTEFCWSVTRPGFLRR